MAAGGSPARGLASEVAPAGPASRSSAASSSPSQPSPAVQVYVNVSQKGRSASGQEKLGGARHSPQCHPGQRQTGVGAAQSSSVQQTADVPASGSAAASA